MGVFGGGENNVEITVTLEGEQATQQATQLEEKIDKLGKTSESSGSGFTSLQAKIITASEAMQAGKIAGELLYSAISALPSAMLSLANAGDKLGDLSASFEAFGGSTKAIDDASARILGILPNIDLLQLANKAMAGGVPEVNKNFADMAEYGRKMGDALGISAKEGIEAVTNALIRGSPQALKKLQIDVDSEKAAQDYAKAMGIVGRELSDLEKKTAIASQAQEIMRTRLASMPATADSVVDGIDAIVAQFTNLAGKTGMAINDNQNLTEAMRRFSGEIGQIDVTSLANNIADLAAKMLGLIPNIAHVIQSLVDWSNRIGLAASAGLDFIQSLQAIAGPLNVVTKLMMGQLPSLADLKNSYVNIANIGMNNYNKKLAEQKDLLDKNTKAVENAGDIEKKYNEQLVKDKADLDARNKKLKEEADARDKAAKALAAQTKATEDKIAADKAAQKQAESALKNLGIEVRKLNEDLKLENLTDSLEKAFKTQDFTSAGRLKEEIKKQIKEGIVQGYKDAGGIVNAQSEPLLEEQAVIETDKVYNSTKEGIEKGVKDGFFESDFPNYLSEMITGSLLEGFKNGFTPETIGAMGDSLSGIFAQKFQADFQKMFSKDGGGFSYDNIKGALSDLGIAYGISSLSANLSDNKKDTQGGIISGAILGASYGSTFGPWGTVIGGVAGAGAGYLAGSTGASSNAETQNRHQTINWLEEALKNNNLSFIKDGNVIEGHDYRFNNQLNNSALFSGLSNAVMNSQLTNPAYIADNAAFNGWGPISGPVQVDQTYGSPGMIAGTNQDLNPGEIGGPGWSGQYWQTFGQEGGQAFNALGAAFSEMAGTMGPQMEQIGVILAENLGGNLDNARMMLQTLGIGAEDLEASFMKIGLSGEQSWHTVEVYMQSIADLTGEGLIGIGDLEGAMNQFINSGGRGSEALISLRNIGIEAMEQGASTMADLRRNLEATGKYTTQQLDAIMGGFEQRGITSLEGIRDASDRALGGVTADAESLGFAWSDSIGQGLEDSIKSVNELKDVMNELPDKVEKNVVIKVSTEYSGADAKQAYADLNSSVGVQRA